MVQENILANTNTCEEEESYSVLYLEFLIFKAFNGNKIDELNIFLINC